jgi:hypothetical protein
VYVSAAAVGCKNLVQAYLNERAAVVQAKRVDPLVRAANMLKALDREISLGRLDTVPKTPTQAHFLVALERDRVYLSEMVELHNDGLASGEALLNAINGRFSTLMQARKDREASAKEQARLGQPRPTRGVDTR